MPKITALPAITALSGDELFPVVEDDDGTPTTSKITVENLAAGLAARTEFSGTYVAKEATAPSDAVASILEWQPSVAARGPLVLSMAEPTFNGTKDVIVYLGLNSLADGSLATAGQHGVAIGMESYYDDGPDINSELYTQFTLPDLTYIRPHMAQFDQGTGHLVANILACPDGANVLIMSEDQTLNFFAFGANRLRQFYNGGTAAFDMTATSANRVTIRLGATASSEIHMFADPGGGAPGGASFAVGVLENTAIGIFAVGSADPSIKGMIVRGRGSQSGNLLEIQSSASAYLSGFTENGYFTTRKAAAPADAELSAGEVAIWFDPTNGAAKVMFKAKETGGTVRTGEVALA